MSKNIFLISTSMRSIHIHQAATTKLPDRSSKFRRQNQIAALQVLLSKVLQALKETPEKREKTFFNITNVYRFQVQ